MENVLNAITNNPMITRILIIVIGFIFILILIQIIKKSLSKRIKSENWYKTKKIINAAAYVLFIFLVLIVYNDRLGGITVALGVAGAGIAFALQEVITSVAGWIAIMVGDFYKPGDRVQVGGIKGDVIDQGILRTTVMELGDWIDGDLYNGRIVRIANSFVFKEPVFNYSADFPFLWNEIKIPIEFGSDYDLTRNILNEITDEITGDCVKESQAHWDKMVRNYAIENASLETMVTMKITDNWVEYTVRYIVNYRSRRKVQDCLFSEILKAIDQSNGLIKLASTTIDITEVPTIKIVKG
jgi:small-conductance mechanosensitive channel